MRRAFKLDSIVIAYKAGIMNETADENQPWRFPPSVRRTAVGIVIYREENHVRERGERGYKTI